MPTNSPWRQPAPAGTTALIGFGNPTITPAPESGEQLKRLVADGDGNLWRRIEASVDHNARTHRNQNYTE